MAASRFPILRSADVQQSRVQDNISGLVGPVAKALQNTPIMGAPPPLGISPTLLNGWSYIFAPPYAGYHRNALGYVYVNIDAQNVSGAPIAAGTPAFALDIGYRPYFPTSFAISANVDTSSCDIAIDGTVSMTSAIPNARHAHFCFSFLAKF